MYPDIFIGDFVIYTWTVFLHLSYIVAVSAVILCRPKDFQLTKSQLFLSSCIYVITALVGAKLLSIFITYFAESESGLLNAIENSGMAFLGAPIAGLITLWLFSLVTRTSFLKTADYIAPFLMVERVLGRFGCLMEGCCYGIPSGLPWRVQIQFEAFPCHPTQAYAMIAAIAIFITMRFQYRHIKDYKGVTFFFVLVFYSTMRFINEFLRVDNVKVLGYLKQSHIAMILLFIIGFIGLKASLKNVESKKVIILTTTSTFIIILLLASGLVLGVLTGIRTGL